MRNFTAARRLAASAFVTLLVALAVPSTVLAGDCPASLPSGVIDEDRYRVGQTIEFFGNYLDFADPGTVSITFERASDDAVRSFQAFNSPDGAWYLMLELTGDLLGTWAVTVVVEQTGATDTCTDEVTITQVRPPNTDTSPGRADSVGSVVPVVPLVLVVALAATVAVATTLVVVSGGSGRRHVRRHGR